MSSFKTFRFGHLLSIVVLLCSLCVNGLTTPYNFCATYTAACNDLLTKVNCPAALISNEACSGSNIDSFIGTCACGPFDLGSNRIAEDLVDYSVKSSVASLLSRVTAENNRVDICTSYTNVCNAFYTVVSCPASQQKNIACNGQTVSDAAISGYNGTCTCGNFDISNNRVAELVEDIALSTAGYVTGAVAANKQANNSNAINFCGAYEELCFNLLNNTLHCPVASQAIVSCATPNDLTTFVGTCTCNTWQVASGRLQENLVDTLLTASNPSLFIKPDTQHFAASAAAIDLCASQGNICNRLFQNLSCPIADQSRACQINGIAEWSTTCTCGQLSVADGRIMEETVDALVNGDIPAFAAATITTTTTTTTTPSTSTTTGTGTTSTTPPPSTTTAAGNNSVSNSATQHSFSFASVLVSVSLSVVLFNKQY